MGAERQAGVAVGEALGPFVGAFVDGLARSGVAHACICPGSRSTPLALLLRRHPAVRVWTHLDERSAAYFALGMAKATRQPVVIVSTSGTAAVNLAPAVVEAYYARVPLLVLTADRPPELRGVGAPQTIDQVRLYGPHVKWFVEMTVPEASPQAIRYARTVACRAAATARAEAAGPVHINFPFREPLIPSRDAPSPGSYAVDDLTPSVGVEQAARRGDAAGLASLAAELQARRGLIVCGPQDDPRFPDAVVRLADELGFPVLADPLSQVRCGPHHSPMIIDSYDAFLRDQETVRDLAPEIVLRFGATPVSKPLLLYLQRHSAARHVLVDCGQGWGDPGLTAGDALHADPSWLCEALLDALRMSAARPATAASQAGWAGRWQRIARGAREALSRGVARGDGPSEPGVFADLAALLPDGATLFVGNSMPVRDLDTFFPGGRRRLRFLANRGASGIDGVVSSALGASAAGDGPLVLVIGDLSFYHDMNGLLAARRYGLWATIVLVHNDGGGIFSFLPQAEDSEHFEELFGTPHGLDFGPAAEMYGLTYHRADSRADLRSALQRSMASPGVALVEVRTDRTANARLHRDMWDEVSRAVRQPRPQAAAP